MNDQDLSRRSFIVSGAGIVAAVAAPSIAFSGQGPKKPPPLAADTVKEFVKVAHSQLDKTKEMLGNDPHLLNATWDWGGGDFEMGIGGAGHMGNREIALFLIGEGARFDVFVAAMLGEFALVKTFIGRYSSLISAKGPHGIPLIAHAKAGGDHAREVVEYLQALKQD